MAISESLEIKNTKTLSEDDINGNIVKLKTNTTELFAIAGSGSPMSFLNEKTVQRIQHNDQTAVFKNIPLEGTARNLACYNGESIHPKERLIITIESGGWKIQTTPFIIVDNHKANIIGRNLLARIGIELIQDNKNAQGNHCATKRRVKPRNKSMCQEQFSTIMRTHRKVKTPPNKTQFSKEFEPVQPKG